MDFKRGFEPYGYDNSTEGYDLAKLNSKSPLDTIRERRGEKLKNCMRFIAICHGNEGNGKGKLVTQGKLLGILIIKTDKRRKHLSRNDLWFKSICSPNQIDQHERWLVADYVLKLRANYNC
jgi:hypothetical protein